MDAFLLPATTYAPANAPSASRVASPLDRRTTFNTIIEDSPQSAPGYFNFMPPPNPQPLDRSAMISPTYLSPTYSEDFPTPRASLQNNQNTPRASVASPTSPEAVSSPKWRRPRDDPDFDELYDMTDDETEEVPLKCSNSVKKVSSANASTTSSARSSGSRYPSLVIPSPSNWPTIEKLQRSAVSPASCTPLPAFSPAQNFLSMLAARNLQVPATSAAPSLDGSLSSEEMEHLSCPSTPEQQAASDNELAGPVQLHPEAMETLHRLSGENDTDGVDQVIEVPEGEMQQVVRSNRMSAPILRRYANSLTASPMDNRSDADPISALSIPSPGGFFSSLRETARHTWSLPATQEVVPSTTTAEQFYGVPWRERPDNPVEHVVEVPASVGNNGSEMTPTALDGLLSPVGEIMEIKPRDSLYEYNENYTQELVKNASANLSRTSLWLAAQETWLEGMLSPTTPTGPEPGNPLSDTITSPSKKSVRFADLVPTSPSAKSDEGVSTDSTFLEGLEFLREITGRFDAFIHRLTRAEAVHLQRRCMPKTHRNLLLGRYELNSPSRIPSSRPVSLFYTDDPNMHKEQIAKAQKEQQALALMRPIFWALEASKLLHGGRLITSPAARVLSHSRDEGTTRVLDLGGQAVCDWAWQVALDFPRTTVYTVSTTAEALVKLEGEEEREIEGPSNHRRTVVPNYWTLPFPNGHFDVVSARSLYALLKTSKPAAGAGDEYDLCLRECLRILKPGGYLEFALLDADVLHAAPGSHTQATSVEFGFSVKTRGYDSQPTKSFVPRLARAGFTDVRRAYTAVPFPRPGASWSDELNVGASVDAAAARADDVFSPTAQHQQRDRSSSLATSGSGSGSSVDSEKTIGPNGEVEPFVAAKQHKKKRDSVVEGGSNGSEGDGNVRGSTKDARDVAGLVGAWAWEKWLVKLRLEMGREEERLGEGVVQALEEGARDGCAWRCLEGWARKGF